MFKNIYNRCKNYLNSYTTMGTVLILLFFLLLPIFTYKASNGFFLILNISVAIVLNDGYYMSLYKYYEINNLLYLMYIIIVRFIFIGIISTLVYYIYYTDSNMVKFLLIFIIAFNLLNLGDILPISMNTILSGYQFKTFSMEIISTFIMICCYIIGLIVIKKLFINKKRDIR